MSFRLCVTVWVARASRPLGHYLFKTTMTSIGSPTEEAPLQPEIRSIVSLAAAHTQKVYFSGAVHYRGPEAGYYPRPHSHDRPQAETPPHHRLQLTGTILSVHRQGQSAPLPSVDAVDPVRPPFY